LLDAVGSRLLHDVPQPVLSADSNAGLSQVNIMLHAHKHASAQLF